MFTEHADAEDGVDDASLMLNMLVLMLWTFSQISWTQLISGLPTPLNPSWQLYKALSSPGIDHHYYDQDWDDDVFLTRNPGGLCSQRNRGRGAGQGGGE